MSNYYPPVGGQVPLAIFLASIQRQAPEVLQGLRGLLPAWERWSNQVAVSFAVLKVLWGGDVADENDRGQCERAREAIVEPIWKWAQTFHLFRKEEPTSTGERFYCLNLFQVVRGTLRAWAGSTEYAGAMEWGVPDPMFGVKGMDQPTQEGAGGKWVLLSKWGGDSLDPQCRLELLFANWDYFRESRTQCRERVLQKVGELLDLMLGDEEAFLREIGAKPASQREIEKHFKWLVQYQVKGLSAPRIAANEFSTRQTIENGYKNAAKLLIGKSWETWLAKHARGRPRTT